MKVTKCTWEEYEGYKVSKKEFNAKLTKLFKLTKNQEIVDLELCPYSKKLFFYVKPKVKKNLIREGVKEIELSDDSSNTICVCTLKKLKELLELENDFLDLLELEKINSNTYQRNINFSGIRQYYNKIINYIYLFVTKESFKDEEINESSQPLLSLYSEKNMPIYSWREDVGIIKDFKKIGKKLHHFLNLQNDEEIMDLDFRKKHNYVYIEIRKKPSINKLSEEHYVLTLNESRKVIHIDGKVFKELLELHDFEMITQLFEGPKNKYYENAGTYEVLGDYKQYCKLFFSIPKKENEFIYDYETIKLHEEVEK